LYERLAALQDILPPSQRKLLHNTIDTSSAWLKTGLSFSGKALWVVSTSVLLAVVPWALAYAEDQQMAEMEREMKMQQSASEVSYFCALMGGYGEFWTGSFANMFFQLLTPGTAAPAQQARPAL
jgi:hypothetical protein